MSQTKISFYNENSAKNAILLTINGVRFYFSYRTLVAVKYSGESATHVNDWGTTTGKHLNWIDGGSPKTRVTGEVWDNHVAQAMQAAGITELPTIDI